MKVLVVLALAALASARSFEDVSEMNTAYGYYDKVGIPLAEKIKQAEEAGEQSRIVGGSASTLGDHPHQAGLLATFPQGVGVCGGSLVSSNRVITAAHCWFDGRNQASSLTVVLGSVLLFSGGNRQETNNIVMHPRWIPLLVRNDVAVIYLTNAVEFTDFIRPISLPSGLEISESFAGEYGLASGFGLTDDNGAITTGQYLSYAYLNIISNARCFMSFPLYLQDSNICTSGVGGVSTCRGDSGGPLVVMRDGRRVLVGITSFGSPMGCEVGMPAAYARVTSFMDFFNQHIN